MHEYFLMHCMKKFRLSTRGIPPIFPPSATWVALLLINNMNERNPIMANEAVIKVGFAYIGALALMAVIMTIVH